MNSLLIISITITKSKSVHGSEPKTDLSTCDMVAYEARKATYEIVQLSATVRDRNLWTSQGTMCWTELYKTQSKNLQVFLETCVGHSYSLIDCVTNLFQRR